MANFADGRQTQRIENYTKFWQKDLSKEKDGDTQGRLESYVDVINGTLFIYLFRFPNNTNSANFVVRRS